jgi:hypothetical protein
MSMEMALESPYYNYVPTRWVTVLLLGLFTVSTCGCWFGYERHRTVGRLPSAL